ncbi:MAG: NADP-dependent malic enzyme [Bdellovibrionota bacterium]
MEDEQNKQAKPMIRREDALAYHREGQPGKIEVSLTKPCATQRDLSMAYTPGVAEPCRDIEADPEKAYEYTSKGNLVAVISNGTAVLGLGDIGPLAGKPVMEGKGVLFKRFAGIDVFDIEVNEKDPDKLIDIVASLEPTFGGINLEDIKSPECFKVEQELIKRMNIPVFHDDQHGTAIISGAAFMNALEVAKKDIKNVKVVFSGAGAAAIAICGFYESLGVRKQNMMLVDSKGVVYKGRTEGMNEFKEKYASDTSARTLADAMKGADAFIGVSVANLVSQDMVRSMAKDPIVFAMANPDPEIPYPDMIASRKDVFAATGRSDFPNQVNNVLGFPFIFRGALDCRATRITMGMKTAAAKALASLTREDVPEPVLKAYGLRHLEFGKDYLIPKPLDSRVLLWVAPAVAKAATDEGVAKKPIKDIEAYRDHLKRFIDRTSEVFRPIMRQAKALQKKIVFPEGDHPKVLQAVPRLVDEEICRPVLLGPEQMIREELERMDVDPKDVDVVNPRTSDKLESYVGELMHARERKGMIRAEALRWMQRRPYYGAMMVRTKEADGMVAGLTRHYGDTLRPVLQIVPLQPNRSIVTGVYMLVLKNKVLFFADTTVNIEPNAETVAETALLAADCAKHFGIEEPKIALLSFSNFGSVHNIYAQKVQRAMNIVKALRPDLIMDGEMQFDTATNPEEAAEYSFSRIQGDANVLIFPNLSAGNIAYQVMHRFAQAESIGPILVGLQYPVNVLQRNASTDDIVRMAAITAVQTELRHKIMAISSVPPNVRDEGVRGA